MTAVTDDRKFCGRVSFQGFGESEECGSRGISSFARRPWPPFLSWPSSPRSSCWGSAAATRSRRDFQNAAQLVKGNLVQVGGAPVGKVTNIDLTPDGQAEVTMTIDDDYAPLRRGTRATSARPRCPASPTATSTCRMAPQSAPKIPDGGVIGQDATTTAVDLDQLFNTFDPATRKALQGVIQGSANQFKGQGKAVNAGSLYLNPSLAASSRLFRELNRDTPAARALHRRLLAARHRRRRPPRRPRRPRRPPRHHDDARSATSSTALADAIRRLPAFMRRANTTFVNLRAALDDLDPLVDDSKPVAKKLRPFLAELRPLARDARPDGPRPLARSSAARAPTTT